MIFINSMQRHEQVSLRYLKYPKNSFRNESELRHSRFCVNMIKRDKFMTLETSFHVYYCFCCGFHHASNFVHVIQHGDRRTDSGAIITGFAFTPELWNSKNVKSYKILITETKPCGKFQVVFLRKLLFVCFLDFRKHCFLKLFVYIYR